tara:strand:+ start:767 stop:928 length:162 start_codon:yes stop_codon:yes gene_type:complete
MDFGTAIAFAIGMLVIILANRVGRLHRARRAREFEEIRDKLKKQKKGSSSFKN